MTQKSGNRDGLQRKVCWWLPYVVLEFDKNEVLIDALGGTIQEPVWMFRAHFDVTRVSEIVLHFYLRNKSKNEVLDNYAVGQSDMFMGDLAFVPDFDRRGTVEQWYNVTSGTGQVNVAVTFRASTSQPLSVDSFDLIKVISKGSFGRIMQVRKKDTSRIYAIKIIRKARLASRNEVTHTFAEHSALAKVNSPFIVPLKFSFQSPAKLYLLLPLNMSGQDDTNSLYEYPDYLAPELILGHGYSKTADWWTLGVLLYEMLAGLPPYYDENTPEMCRKITQDPLRFGDEFGAEARFLLMALLTRDPSQRLGANGADEIKEHPFFSMCIDFERLLAKKIRPPFKPSVAGSSDISGFNPIFTSEEPVDNIELDTFLQTQFNGFSYQGGED
ncbi:hypothetical protein FRC01_001565 [Tulasnella sp. 417]|nr:hypothetical protein FRC01_001565 [Tulasnella sp. 417]